MAFTVKPYLKVLDGMIAHARLSTDKITDYNIGGVYRTLLEAAAMEIDALYRAMYWAIHESIPIAIYNGFGFTKIPAVSASGIVTITLNTDNAHGLLLVPQNARFRSRSTGVIFRADADHYLPPEQSTITFNVTAEVGGISGNIPAFDLEPLFDGEFFGFTAVGMEVSTNLLAFTSGVDEETTASQAVRFMEFVKSLPRGTNDAVLFAAKNQVIVNSLGAAIEVINYAAKQEEAGHTVIYVQSNLPSTSPAMLSKIQSVIDGYTDANGVKVAGYRPTGVKVDVFAFTKQLFNVSLSVMLDAGYTLDSIRDPVKSAINAQLVTIAQGSYVNQADIIKAVYQVRGILSASIVGAFQPIQCNTGKTLEVNTLTVTLA